MNTAPQQDGNLEHWLNNSAISLLTNIATPTLIEEQLAVFTQDTIHAVEVTEFNAKAASQELQNMVGKKVLSADFGGDKGRVRSFTVTEEGLELTSDYADDIQGDQGKGYLEVIERAAKFATENQLAMGLSWGGPLENGSKMVAHPKATVLYKELNDRYHGDFVAISDAIKICLNDGPAGLVAGAVHAWRQLGASNVIFPINGGGLGVGVLTNNKIYATEAGHVEGVAALNTYDQTAPCGVFDATFVCLENLGSNKRGIEAQWEKLTGSYMRARNIEDRYKEGNTLAGELYDHSALVVAHLVAGVAQAFELDLSGTTTAAVCDGSAFKFPKYGERIQQILEQHTGRHVNLIMTKDLFDANSNVFMEGAAILALSAR